MIRGNPPSVPMARGSRPHSSHPTWDCRRFGRSIRSDGASLTSTVRRCKQIPQPAMRAQYGCTSGAPAVASGTCAGSAFAAMGGPICTGCDGANVGDDIEFQAVSGAVGAYD